MVPKVVKNIKVSTLRRWEKSPEPSISVEEYFRQQRKVAVLEVTYRVMIGHTR